MNYFIVEAILIVFAAIFIIWVCNIPQMYYVRRYLNQHTWARVCIRLFAVYCGFFVLLWYIRAMLSLTAPVG